MCHWFCRVCHTMCASESAAAPGVSESAAALGARASPATSPSSAGALHTFTLDSGASRCFFRDCTSLTPLAALVPVSLADPVGGPVVARASTVLSCPAVPSSSLSGLHLPMFSTNLVSNAAIQDVWADTLFPGGQRVAICTCSRTGRHLATFIRRPGSSLYTLTTTAAQVAEAGQVAASSQVSASGQLAASCSCPVLSHQTLLWHHHLGHPSLPRLRSMHSRLLVFGLPRSLPSLPRSPAVPCFPCIQGRQRAAPHSSDFPPTTPPLQTLHKDVWGPAPVGGTDQERYFLLVVDNYTRYTTVFPLRCKADVSGVLIPWIRATRRQLREWFSQDFPVLRLHSDRGETSPTLWWMGKVGDATVFWVWGALSLVRDAKANKLSSRTLRCVFLGFPTDAPPWHFYHPRSRRVFSSHDVTFDESVCNYRLHPHASHPVDRPPLVEPLEVSSDSSGLAEGDDPAADDAAATRRSPRLETPPGFPPRPSSPPPQPAAVDSGAENAGAEPGGAEKEGEGSGGATSGGAGSWGATAGGADSGGPASSSGGGAVGDPAGGYGPTGAGAASPGGSAVAGGTGGTAGGAGGAAGAGDTRGAAGAGGARATSPRGATSAGGAGPTSPGGTAGARGVGATGTTGAAGSGGTGGTAGAGAARAGGTAGVQGAGGATGAASTRGAGGTTGARGPHAAGGRGAAGAGGAGGAAGAAGAGGAGVGGAGAAGTELRGPFFYPHPQSSLPPPDSVHRQVLTSTPIRARRVARPRPPGVPSTHGMALRPSSVPQHVVLPEPPVSSLSYVPDPESDFAHAASATITRLLATVVTDPDLEPTAAFALVTELFDFAARSRLDYIASLVTKSASVCPPSVRGELALGSDVLEDRQFELECLVATLPRFASMLLCPHPDALDIPTPRSYADAIAGEYTSHWETAMDGEMASWKSTGTYVVEVPPPGANIVDGMWIFRVKRPPGSPPAFKALRRQVYGLLQAPRKWHDTLRTTLAALGFAPSSLFLRTDTTLPPFYVLVYVLQRFGFQFSSPQPTPLSTGHSLSAPSSDEFVEPSGPYPELVGCLMYLMTCTRPDLAYTLSLLARYVAPSRHQKVHWDVAKRVLRYLCSASGMGLVLGGQGSVVLTGHSDASWAEDQATQRSSQGYTFSLGSGSVSWRSTRSSSVLSSSYEAEIYAGAMAA
ncbi:unnamed protein product [Closterium sp. NIES-53]